MMGTASVTHASEKKDALGCHWQSDEFLSNRKTDAGKFQEKFGKYWRCAVKREGNLLSVTFKGDVTFYTNSTELRTESYFEINRVADVLNKYPDTFVRVEGHTDSKGSDEYNMNLLKRRADTVKTLLVQRGVAVEGF